MRPQGVKTPQGQVRYAPPRDEPHAVCVLLHLANHCDTICLPAKEGAFIVSMPLTADIFLELAGSLFR